MSVGPLGMIGSNAGAPLAQSQGTDVNKAQQESTDQMRQTELNAKAEQAEGVGQTEQDEQTSERDADGRRLWEASRPPASDSDEDGDTRQENDDRKTKDPTGQKGTNLDLSG